MDEEYTLRYSGGMAADINHILKKGQGVFSYPPSPPKYPSGKLRLLFECNPFSFLMEQAGGMSSNGDRNAEDRQVERDVPERIEESIGDHIGVARQGNDPHDVPGMDEMRVRGTSQPRRWVPHPIPVLEGPGVPRIPWNEGRRLAGRGTRFGFVRHPPAPYRRPGILRSLP